MDADVSMRSHVSKTVAACFAILRQLRSIHRSVPRSVLQSLVSSLVLQRLDYGNATLAPSSASEMTCIVSSGALNSTHSLTLAPSHLTKRMQSVFNSAARLVFSASRYTASRHS